MAECLASVETAPVNWLLSGGLREVIWHLPESIIDMPAAEILASCNASLKYYRARGHLARSRLIWSDG